MSETDQREPRRIGRPRLGADHIPAAEVHLRLPAPHYDRVYALARARRETVQTVIRRSVARLLEEETRDQS